MPEGSQCAGHAWRRRDLDRVEHVGHKEAAESRWDARDVNGSARCESCGGADSGLGACADGETIRSRDDGLEGLGDRVRMMKERIERRGWNIDGRVVREGACEGYIRTLK